MTASVETILLRVQQLHAKEVLASLAEQNKLAYALAIEDDLMTLSLNAFGAAIRLCLLSNGRLYQLDADDTFVDEGEGEAEKEFNQLQRVKKLNENVVGCKQVIRDALHAARAQQLASRADYAGFDLSRHRIVNHQGQTLNPNQHVLLHLPQRSDLYLDIYFGEEKQTGLVLTLFTIQYCFSFSLFKLGKQL